MRRALCAHQPPQFYGNGIGGDELANTVVGGYWDQNPVYQRFRASQSSQLVSFTFYYLGGGNPGYSAGTIGPLKAEIYPDDGTNDHFPDVGAAPLASITLPPLVQNLGGRVITFDSPPTLVAGTLYHLVIWNVDTDTVNNYFSVDHWYYFEMPNGLPNNQRTGRYSNVDWAHGRFDGSFIPGAWEERVDRVPILSLQYANGATQGQSYGERSVFSADQVGKIQGSQNRVREEFTVSGGSRNVSSLWFRVLREESSGLNDLQISVKDSVGTALKSVSVSASTIAAGPAFDPDNPNIEDLDGAKAKWRQVDIGPLALLNGQKYYLEFSTADGGTTYWAWVNRRLSENYSYGQNTAFDDGVSQKTADGGSTWTSLGRVPNENNLQFFFQ